MPKSQPATLEKLSRMIHLQLNIDYKRPLRDHAPETPLSSSITTHFITTPTQSPPRPRKILLLGPRDSGKSTLLKQLKAVFSSPSNSQPEPRERAFSLVGLPTPTSSISSPFDVSSSNSLSPSKYSRSRSSSKLSQAAPVGMNGIEVSTSTQNHQFSMIPLSPDPDIHVHHSSHSCRSPNLSSIRTMYNSVSTRSSSEYSTLERNPLKRIVYDNVFDSITCLIEGMHVLGIVPSDPEAVASIAFIRDMERDRGSSCSHELASAINCIWKDDDAQSAYRRRNEFFIQDTAEYFLSQVNRFASPDYVPTDQDMLYIRNPTSSITTTHLSFSLNQNNGSTETITPQSVNSVSLINYHQSHFEVIDTAGHRSFRSRWAPYISSSHLQALFFVVSLSSYDQYLEEEESVNRMVDAIELFRSVVWGSTATSSEVHSNPQSESNTKEIDYWKAIDPSNILGRQRGNSNGNITIRLVEHVPVILFLNKADLFREKIRTISISNFFPDYQDTPGRDRFDTGIEFFVKKFMSPEEESQDVHPRRVYCYVVTATNTPSIQETLISVLREIFPKPVDMDDEMLIV